MTERGKKCIEQLRRVIGALSLALAVSQRLQGADILLGRRLACELCGQGLPPLGFDRLVQNRPLRELAVIG
jgi:hypothetical protein